MAGRGPTQKRPPKRLLDALADEPVDLARVRRALNELDELARTQPQLRGPRGLDNVDGWLATLEAEDMEHDAQFALRLPASVVARLDALGDRLRAEHPGAKFSRADVTRILILEGLDRAEAAAPGGPAAPTPPVPVQEKASAAAVYAPPGEARSRTKLER